MLVHLLVLACNPAAAQHGGQAAATQQCLTVFFHAYAGHGAAGQARLAAAALPAARRALHLGPAPAKSPAAQLLRYVLSLLQVPNLASSNDLTLTGSAACHGTLLVVG